MRDNLAAQRALQGRTAAHYDAYPFDFLTPEDEAAIRDMQPAPFRRFVDRHIDPTHQVAEIGCGPGRGTLFLNKLGLSVVAVDLSERSLALARRRAPGAQFVRASNLALPFGAASFDAVVSDGVIHHTPDPHASFCENVRILKAGGALYLGVYSRRRYYYYIYTYLGPPVRWLERHEAGRALLFATLIPAYWLIHLVKSRGKRTWRGAVNFFYDYLITPRASFHSREEISAWGQTANVDLVEYDPSLGNVHVFVFRKSTSA